MTKNPITGTTVCPTNGMNPSAKSNTPHAAALTTIRRLSRAEITNSRHNDSPDSGAVPSGETSRSTDSESFS